MIIEYMYMYVFMKLIDSKIAMPRLLSGHVDFIGRFMRKCPIGNMCKERLCSSFFVPYYILFV